MGERLRENISGRAGVRTLCGFVGAWTLRSAQVRWRQHADVGLISNG